MAGLQLVSPPRPKSLDLAATNQRLGGASAETTLRWARETFGDSLVVSSSFGAESALMLHLIQRSIGNVRVVFIDTGYLFPETYRFAEELTRRFDLDVHVFNPLSTTARQEALFGKRWEGTEAERLAYYQENKVEPMQRALATLAPQAWLAGLRQHQTAFRKTLSPVEDQGNVYKVHPILSWTQTEVDDYMRAHDLPYHPLYAKGYRSIGDEHSTFPTLAGEDPRAGRNLGVQKECGLHLPRLAG